MFEPENERMTVSRQAELLSLPRTCLYEKPTKQPSARTLEDILIMHKIDEIYTECPFYGYRRVCRDLNKAAVPISLKKTRRLMRKMGLYAIYPQRNLSRMYHRQYIHPYLLRHLPIVRANQVWAVDLTYVRMGSGFMYLFVIIDLYSRYIIDYELSSTLEKGFVLKCLERAFRTAKPEIINSDQGSHFTNEDYVNLLTGNGIRISMDSKGRALDNIFVERFFRSLKYELIYINEFENPRNLRKGINQYMTFYNYERPHQSLDYQSPAEYYHPNLQLQSA
jgi:putative transposase